MNEHYTSNRTDKTQDANHVSAWLSSNGGNSLGDLSEIANMQWDKENNGTNPYQFRPSSSKSMVDM